MTLPSSTGRGGGVGAAGACSCAGAAAEMLPPLSAVAFLLPLRDTLSRGLGGVALSGAALSALGGRPLRGVAAFVSLSSDTAFSFGGRPRRGLGCSGSGLVFSSLPPSADGSGGDSCSTFSRAASRRSFNNSSIFSKEITTSPGSGWAGPSCTGWEISPDKSGAGAPGTSGVLASGAACGSDSRGRFSSAIC